MQDIYDAIEDVIDKKEPDYEGAKYFQEHYNPSVVRKSFIHVMDTVLGGTVE